MEIYIKIGTLPGQVMHLCRKSKVPVIGERVWVKSENKSYIKSESVVVDEIRNISGRELFVAYRL